MKIRPATSKRTRIKLGGHMGRLILLTLLGTIVISSVHAQIPPISLSGSGTQVSSSFTLQSGLSIFRMTHNGSSNFFIWLKDSQGNNVDLLVNEIGSFTGSTAVGINSSGTFFLDIGAGGSWSVTIEQPRPTSAPATRSFSGTGQQVPNQFSLSGGLAVFEMTHNGSSNFFIWLRDSQGNRVDLLVNEIGSFTGSTSTQVQAGIFLLEVGADGAWTVTISNAPPNGVPVANAGQNITANEGTQVALNGSGSSDPDGDSLSFSWTQTAGPTVTLSGANSAGASFTAPDVDQNTTLIFRLSVSDGVASSSDSVTVSVLNVVVQNNPPTADAGTDQEVSAGELVTLSGTGSDPDGDSLTFTWTQVSGAGVSLQGANTKTATFTAPALNGASTLELRFRLRVSDGARSVVDEVKVTVVSSNSDQATVLVANFLNGNNDAFNSRIYLWNPSKGAGSVTVRVFTLPIAGGLAQELTSTPLNLGTLGAKSGLNIKLAEDILASLGITTPYITDGGNLTVEFTIGSENVQGVAQVFSGGFAFGTYPLQEISATSTGSPTVLVAEFSNGNSAVLSSRVYLFNPSTGAGNVTVRVFTLPLRGGLAQELTTSPLNLGTLEARSARNVKLAEDILAVLTPLPYTTDGGNLVLEFTIQAANVRGVAQVFTSDFAFGTYPLGVVSITDSTDQ